MCASLGMQCLSEAGVIISNNRSIWYFRPLEVRHWREHNDQLIKN
jgi:hypothetical protein